MESNIAKLRTTDRSRVNLTGGSSSSSSGRSGNGGISSSSNSNSSNGDGSSSRSSENSSDNHARNDGKDIGFNDENDSDDDDGNDDDDGDDSVCYSSYLNEIGHKKRPRTRASPGTRKRAPPNPSNRKCTVPMGLLKGESKYDFHKRVLLWYQSLYGDMLVRYHFFVQ
jgi:hypothetical protein